MLSTIVLFISCLLFARLLLGSQRASHDFSLLKFLKQLTLQHHLVSRTTKKITELSICYLSCPKLYCPVKRRGDKKMREVYRSNCCMAVDTCDWSLVSFKHLTDSSFAVLEYITRVKLSGNHTSADRDSTEMQFIYSHKTILLLCMDVTPLQKASSHHNRITEDQA